MNKENLIAILAIILMLAGLALIVLAFYNLYIYWYKGFIIIFPFFIGNGLINVGDWLTRQEK